MVKTMFKQKERGAAVVEFALVLPLLLLIVFGIIEFSILFYDKAVITNASREVAREFAIYKDSSHTQDQLECVLERYIYGDIPGICDPVLDPDGYPMLISMADDNGPVLTTLPAAADKDKDVQYVVARVEYKYKFVFLPGFFTESLPEIDLSAETTMRNEGYKP